MKYGMMLKVLTDISGKEKLKQMRCFTTVFSLKKTKQNKTIPGVG